MRKRTAPNLKAAVRKDHVLHSVGRKYSGHFHPVRRSHPGKLPGYYPAGYPLKNFDQGITGRDGISCSDFWENAAGEKPQKEDHKQAMFSFAS